MERKWKNIQDIQRLAEELQKYSFLYEKVKKGYKERDQNKNAWRAVETFSMILLWKIRNQAILRKAIYFSS